MTCRGVTVFLPLLLVQALAFPASGGGTLDAGVLFMRVDDRFGHSCSVPVGGFCLFTVEGGGSPGGLSIDAYQRLNYIGIATNFSSFRHVAGDQWLLPDQAVTLRTSDAYLPHPLFIMLTETWHETRRPKETDAIQFSEDNFTLTHPYVSWDELGTIEPTTWTFVYDGWFGYDRVGPFDGQAGNSSDQYYSALGRGLCTEENGEWGCDPETTVLLSQYYALTPNVNSGIELHRFEVATNPGELTPPVYPSALPASNLTTNGTWLTPLEVVEEEAEAQPPAKQGTTPGGFPPSAERPEDSPLDSPKRPPILSLSRSNAHHLLMTS